MGYSNYIMSVTPPLMVNNLFIPLLFMIRPAVRPPVMIAMSGANPGFS